MNYHASCSIVYGLAETAKDVERARSPDIATMKKMLTDLEALRKTAGAFSGNSTAADIGGAAPVAGPALAAKPVAPPAAAPAAANTASDEVPTCPYFIAPPVKPTPVAKPAVAAPPKKAALKPKPV